jgi:hypothetical protein
MPRREILTSTERMQLFAEDGIDRRFYELCVLAELKNALRSGDAPGMRSKAELLLSN